MIEKVITLEELEARDSARMQEIISYLRMLDGPDGVHPGDPPTPQHEGPHYFYHKIKIKWACRWRRDLYLLENYGRAYDAAAAALSPEVADAAAAAAPNSIIGNNNALQQNHIQRRKLAEFTRRTRPFSKSFPGLFRSALSPSFARENWRNGGRISGEHSKGMTADEFKDMVERRDPLNPDESAFHGLALVDLYSPREVIKAHADIPPIFDKKMLRREHFTGYMADTVMDGAPGCNNVKKITNFCKKKSLIFVKKKSLIFVKNYKFLLKKITNFHIFAPCADLLWRKCFPLPKIYSAITPARI